MNQRSNSNIKLTKQDGFFFFKKKAWVNGRSKERKDKFVLIFKKRKYDAMKCTVLKRYRSVSNKGWGIYLNLCVTLQLSY